MINRLNPSVTIKATPRGNPLSGALLITRKRALALCILALGYSMISPANSQQQQLSMLDQLESGRWELHSRAGGTIMQSICVQNGRKFIQLRHPQNQCEHYIVDDQNTAVTVQYTCRGNGYGRTQIRRESSRLIQIESQGITNGYPFDLSAEARRVGECNS